MRPLCVPISLGVIPLAPRGLGIHNRLSHHTHKGNPMSNTAMLNQNALMARLLESPEGKALVLQFQTEAKEALQGKLFRVEALDTELTLPEIAQMYQGLKSIPNGLYATAEDRKASFAYTVSQECLSIIKGAGYKADWDGIVALVSFA